MDKSVNIQISKRNYGIDLLRIVSMYMIIVLHFIGKGKVWGDLSVFSVNYNIARFLEIATYCSVNCYAIISGYVGYNSKQKYSGSVYLIYTVLFYVAVMTVLGFLFYPGADIVMAARSVMDAFRGGYWYFTSYICASFFFPCVNTALRSFDEKQSKSLVIGIFVLLSVIPIFVFQDIFKMSNGYSPAWLLAVYTLGAYIKKYDVDKEKSVGKYLAIYFALTVIAFIVSFVLNKVGFGDNISPMIISYTSPFMVLMSVALLIAFSNIKPGNVMVKVIASLAPLTFGVYLIHTQYFVWKLLNNRFTWFSGMNPVVFILSILGSALAIYIVCSIIDFVRKFIFDKLNIRKLSEITVEKVKGIFKV